MKVDTVVAATRLEIIVYATIGEEAYETELVVVGASHGDAKKVIKERPRTKLMKKAIARKNERREGLLPSSVVASIKHDGRSTNPFDDHIPFDESKHDRATNPFDDE